MIAARLKAQKPILGICLGAQLMARALGARVYPGPAKEIGWKPLTLTRRRRRACWRRWTDHAGAALAWRYLRSAGRRRQSGLDRYLRATRLSPSAVMRLAFQFHPEAQAQGFERWLIGHACEIAATPGVTVPGLRADTAQILPPALAKAASRCCATGWRNC